MPRLEGLAELQIPESDLEITFTRSGGARAVSCALVARSCFAACSLFCFAQSEQTERGTPAVN